MIYAIDSFPACHSNLWERINGWEVVAAVVIIMASWTVTSIANMYFMAKVMRQNERSDKSNFIESVRRNKDAINSSGHGSDECS